VSYFIILVKIYMNEFALDNNAIVAQQEETEGHTH